MTAIALTPDQTMHAIRVARRLGAAFYEARKLRRLSRSTVARRIYSHPNTLRRFERGIDPNVKLGNVLRMLGYFDLTIAVVPIGPTLENHQ